MARLCLFGASDDTGNLGVSALLRAVLAGIAERAPAAELVVFDHRPGEAEVLATIGDRAVTYRRVGAPVTRRLQRPEAFARLARLRRAYGRQSSLLHYWPDPVFAELARQP